MTPLSQAVQEGHTAIVELLLNDEKDKRRYPDINVNRDPVNIKILHSSHLIEWRGHKP